MNRSIGLGFLVLSVIAPAAASAQDAPVTATASEPVSGFSLTGRLGMVNTAGLDGLGGALGGLPPLVVGFDMGSFTIGVGPAYHNFSTKVDDLDPTSVGMVGAHAVATLIVSDAAGGKAQLYPLLGLGTAIGLTSDDVELDSSLFIQAQLGLGLRYFLAPNVAAHVEFGEGINRLSITDTRDTTSTTSLLTTWGNLGLSIIFG